MMSTERSDCLHDESSYSNDLLVQSVEYDVYSDCVYYEEIVYLVYTMFEVLG